ncbi:MAG TPA: hypothetical protein VME46_23665, partial [Acidimicrobiales bacterium]|nr:hypothetical protein [Acidimicrobiales bacterium]
LFQQLVLDSRALRHARSQPPAAGQRAAGQRAAGQPAAGQPAAKTPAELAAMPAPTGPPVGPGAVLDDR